MLISCSTIRLTKLTKYNQIYHFYSFLCPNYFVPFDWLPSLHIVIEIRFAKCILDYLLNILLSHSTGAKKDNIVGKRNYQPSYGDYGVGLPQAFSASNILKNLNLKVILTQQVLEEFTNHEDNNGSKI